MYCTKCGKKLPDDSLFCVYCGSNLGPAPVTEQADNDSKKGVSSLNEKLNTEKTRAVVKPVLILLGVIAAVSLIIVFAKRASEASKEAFREEYRASEDDINGIEPLGDSKTEEETAEEKPTSIQAVEEKPSQATKVEPTQPPERVRGPEIIDNYFTTEEEMLSLDIRTGEYTMDINHQAIVFVDDDYNLMCRIRLFEQPADYEFLCIVDKNGPVHNCMINDDIDPGLQAFIQCRFTIEKNGDGIIIASNDPMLELFCGKYKYGPGSIYSESTDYSINSADKGSDGYILPNSNMVKLTDSDLRGLSPKELTYARNEIYARHGYVFKSDELNDYFFRMSWYVPVSNNNNIKLNNLEIANMEFIKDYQSRKGLEYKPE